MAHMDEAEFVERLMRGISDRAMVMAMEKGYPTEEGMEKVSTFFGQVVIAHLHHLAVQYDSVQLLEAFYSRVGHGMEKEDGRG